MPAPATKPINSVVVVGGTKSIVSTIKKHLQGHGIEIVAHLADVAHKGKKKNIRVNALPAADGVIALVDTISHGVWDSTRVLADKADMVYVGAPRKWAKAEPILRAQGFLPPASNGSIRQAPQAELEEMALSYVVEERDKGRIPKYAEVNAWLQRAFGPDTELDKAGFDRVHSKAAVAVPRVESSGTVFVTAQQVMDWASALIEENPERILDLKGLANRVRNDLTTNFKPTKILQLVKDVAGRFKRRCLSSEKNDREWRNGLIKDWLKRRYYQPWKDGKAVWPRRSDINDVGTKIFYRQVPAGLFIDARAEVFGEWSRDLIQYKQAYSYYAQNPPKGKATIEAFFGMLQNGTIKSLSSSVKTYTSKLAIDEYKARHDVEKGVAELLAELEATTTTSKPPTKVESQPSDTTKFVDESAKPAAEIRPAPPVDTRSVAEDVALEVATMIGDMLDKRLGPLVNQVNGLVASVEQSHKILKDRIDVIEANVRTVASRCPSVEDVSHAVDKAIDPLNGRIKGLYAKVGEVKTQAEEQAAANRSTLVGIVRQIDETKKQLTVRLTDTARTLSDRIETIEVKGGGGSDGLTLRGLGQIAQETGMRVSIEAGPVKGS
jgi:methyl-accepting chemotaxis protein